MPGPSERRKTTSFQLNEGLHRAVQETDASIGDLAEEGVVHEVADGLNGLCWLCGNYISQNGGSELIGRDQLNRRAGTTVFDEPQRWKFEATDDVPADERFEHIAGRIMLPDDVVEFCYTCSGLVDQEEFWALRHFPTAYYALGAEFSCDIGDYAYRLYAAEVAAVTLATSTSLYRQTPEAAYWWSVHPAVRSEILNEENAKDDVKEGLEPEHRPWFYIGLYNNAYWWGWGETAQPVFEGAIQETGRHGLARRIRGQNIGFDIASSECPACSAPDYHGFCDRCFYGEESCEQCGGDLEIRIKGEARRECEDCGGRANPPYSEEEFAVKYADVLLDIQRYIPAERRQDVGRIVDKDPT